MHPVFRIFRAWPFLLAPVLASAVTPLNVSVTKTDSGYFVRADADVMASPAIAWQVLTDFNHLADYVPDMRVSRIVSEPGEPLRVEQQGIAHTLFFSHLISVEFAVEMRPPDFVQFKAVRGNLQHAEGSWRIAKSTFGCRIEYTGTSEPDFWIPPLIGPALIRNQIEEQMHGVVEEMNRRARD